MHCQLLFPGRQEQALQHQDLFYLSLWKTNQSAQQCPSGPFWTGKPWHDLERVIGFLCQVMPGSLWVTVTGVMQPQKITVECSTINLLCCSMWKFIFLLQANSCSNFWNSWIPRWGETIVVLWNSGSYLKVKFQCFRSSPGFPLYLSVCNFGSWSLREAEVARLHVFCVWTGISGRKCSLKAVFLLGQTCHSIWACGAHSQEHVCTPRVRDMWGLSTGTSPVPCPAQPVLDIRLRRKPCAWCAPEQPRAGALTSPSSQRGKAFPEQGCCLQEQLQSFGLCLSMLVSWEYLLLAFRMTISCDPYSSLRMSCNQMSTGGVWDFCVTKISFLDERFHNWAMSSVWGFCMACPTKWQLNATDPTSSPRKMLVDLCFVLEACEYFHKSRQERTAAPSSMSNTEHSLLGTSPAFYLASLIPYDSTCW